MVTKIDTILLTNTLPFYQKKGFCQIKRKRFYEIKLEELMEIPGIGEKKALELINEGMTTIKKLEKAVQENKLN